MSGEDGEQACLDENERVCWKDDTRKKGLKTSSSFGEGEEGKKENEEMSKRELARCRRRRRRRERKERKRAVSSRDSEIRVPRWKFSRSLS